MELILKKNEYSSFVAFGNICCTFRDYLRSILSMVMQDLERVKLKWDKHVNVNIDQIKMNLNSDKTIHFQIQTAIENKMIEHIYVWIVEIHETELSLIKEHEKKYEKILSRFSQFYDSEATYKSNLWQNIEDTNLRKLYYTLNDLHNALTHLIYYKHYILYNFEYEVICKVENIPFYINNALNESF